MYPPIQNLRAFVAVVNAGQFRIAADQLGVSESAVSHQIARLEAQLGIQLLERGRSGVTMTDVGRVFFAQTSTGLREIELGLEAVKRVNSTVVTISAPRTLSSLWLAPNLATFYEANPSIEVQVFATDRVCDLRSEGIDFALRRSKDNWPGCELERFCSEDIFPVATRRLSERADHIGWNQALKNTPLILNEAHPDEWERWSTETGISIPKYAKFRRLGSYDQVQAAAIHGLGIAMARTPLCLEALADGRLQRLAHRSCRTHEYQLIWPSGRTMHNPQSALHRWINDIRPEDISPTV